MQIKAGSIVIDNIHAQIIPKARHRPYPINGRIGDDINVRNAIPVVILVKNIGKCN